MITIPDDALVTEADLAPALRCEERTARDWIKANGGTRICGAWVILGAALKVRLGGTVQAPAASAPVASVAALPRRTLD